MYNFIMVYQILDSIPEGFVQFPCYSDESLNGAVPEEVLDSCCLTNKKDIHDFNHEHLIFILVYFG